MEVNDIIEKVNKPSDCISLMVVAPKPSTNDIRVVASMKWANTGIKREIPTIEEIIFRKSGSSCFSELEIRISPN